MPKTFLTLIKIILDKEKNIHNKGDKMELTAEQERALRELDMASTNLKRAVGGKAGETLEKKYGEAYAKCYKLGLKQWPPLVCRTTR